MVGDGTQGRVFLQPVIRNVERLRETVLRHVVNVGNIRDGHPRADRGDIAGLDESVILLKLLVCLNRASGGKKRTNHRHTQKKAYANKFDAYDQACFLSLLRHVEDNPTQIP
jgi:hypothetical protein